MLDKRHHHDITLPVGLCSLGLVAPMMLPAWSSVSRLLLPGLGLVDRLRYPPWEDKFCYPKGIDFMGPIQKMCGTAKQRPFG